MKAKDHEAISKEAERIFYSNFKKLKVTSAGFWSVVKWKILGIKALTRAIHHDNEILKGISAELRKLNEDIERGHYYIEVTMDDAGIHPLPCPLCHGEKTIFLRTEVVFENSFLGAFLYDVYGECPICWGSGYMPALTEGQERLLKESVPLREIDRS